MKNYKRNYRNKATVCVSNVCGTVYGDAAKIVTGFAVVVAAIVAISSLSRALK
jgi:hypothetical protein